jgi:hypothetical protein
LSIFSRRNDLEIARSPSGEIKITPRDLIVISKSDSFETIKERIAQKKLKLSALDEYLEIINDIESKESIDFVNLAYQLSQYLRIANRNQITVENYYYEFFDYKEIKK